MRGVVALPKLAHILMVKLHHPLATVQDLRPQLAVETNNAVFHELLFGLFISS